MRLPVFVFALALHAAQGVNLRGGKVEPGMPKWMRPPTMQTDAINGKGQLGAINGGAAILKTKGSETINPIPTMPDFMVDASHASEPPSVGKVSIGYGTSSEKTMQDPFPTPQQPMGWGLTSSSALNPMYSPPVVGGPSGNTNNGNRYLTSTDPALNIMPKASDISVPDAFIQINNKKSLAKKEIPEFMSQPDSPSIAGSGVTVINSVGSPVPAVAANMPAYPVNGGAPLHPSSYSYGSTHLLANSQPAAPSLLEKAEAYRSKKEIPEFMAQPDSPSIAGSDTSALQNAGNLIPATASNMPAYPTNGGAPVHPAAYAYSGAGT